MSIVKLNGQNACADVDPEVFFPKTPAAAAAAKVVCARCPVTIRNLCLANALAEPKQWGVWGGRRHLSATR